MRFLQVEKDMLKNVEDIRKEVDLLSDLVFNKKKDKIFLAWKTVFYLIRTAYNEGRLEMEVAIEEMKVDHIPFYEMLKIIVLLVVDGTDPNIIYEILTNDYYAHPDLKADEKFILYIYMIFVRQIYREEEGLYGYDWDKECSLTKILDIHLNVIPEKYQEEFRMRIPYNWL